MTGRRVGRCVSQHQGQRGFAYIAAVIIMVVMATLATAMVRINTVQLTSANQDLLAIRATQAARAGVEWGLYQLKSNTCNASRTLTDFVPSTSFTVTVLCSYLEYNEGESAPNVPIVKRIYRIDATACNIGASCPSSANATSVEYVERRRVATACMTTTLGDCY